MNRIITLINWLLKLLFSGIVIIVLALILFLYKPSFFIDDLEVFITEFINENISEDINFKLDSIKGNFVSGFYLDDVKIKQNESEIGFIRTLYVNPNISDIFLFKIAFSNISLIEPQFKEIGNLKLPSKQSTYPQYNIKYLQSKLPFSYHVDEFHIDNGVILFDKNKFARVNLSASIEYDEQWIGKVDKIDIIGFNDHKLQVNSGDIFVNLNQMTIKANSFRYDLNFMQGESNFEYDYRLNRFNQFSWNQNRLNIENYDIQNISLKSDKSSQDKLGLKSNFTISEKNYSQNLIIDFTNSINSEYEIRVSENDSLSEIDLVSLITLNSKNSNLTFDITKLKIDKKQILDTKLNCQISTLNNYNCNVEIKEVTDGKLKIEDSELSFKFTKNELEIDNSILKSNKALLYIDKAVFSEKLNSLKANAFINDWLYFDELLQIESLFDSKLITADIDYSINKLDFNAYLSNASYDNGRVKSKKIHVKANQHKELYGFKIITNGVEINNDIHFDSLQLLGEKSGKTISGELSAINNVNGDNFNLIFNTLNDSLLNIEKFEGQLKNVPLMATQFQIHKLDDGIISTSPITLNLDEGSLYSNLSFKDDNNYEAKIRTSNMDLSLCNKIFNFTTRINGLIDGEGYVSNNNGSQTILSNFKLKDGSFDDIIFKNLEFQGSLRDNRATIANLNIDTDLGNLYLNGWASMSGDYLSFSIDDSLQISGNFDNFDISYFERYFPWEQETSGLISGELIVKGKAASPRIGLSPMIVNPKFDKINGESISGELIYKNGRLYFKGINFITEFGKYTGTGSIPSNLNFFRVPDLDITNKPLDFIITGQSSSFEFLAPYFQQIEDISGKFNTQLGISGTLKNPIREGQISIQEADLQILQLDNPIKNINGVAKIGNNQLIIKSMNAKLQKPEDDLDSIEKLLSSAKSLFSRNKDSENENNIVISGTMDLNEFFNPNFNILIEGDNVYLNSTYGQFNGYGDAEFFFTGKDSLNISGTFVPSPNNFTLYGFGDNYSIDMATQYSGKLIGYDIHIPLNNGIYIDTDDANILVDGELNITSLGHEDISFSGKINIIDGTFSYNDNEFTQTDGILILDPTKNTPYAEVNAQTYIGGEQIDVTFIGFLDNPNLLLESTTQLYSQSEIIQLLTFNENTSLEEQTGTSQVGDLITNYMEKELERNVSKYSDLDDFKVHRSGSILSGFSDANVDVYLGKRISSNLYINTKINLNEFDKPNEYEVLYRLNRQMSIEAKIDENQYWHLNYRWKYKY